MNGSGDVPSPTQSLDAGAASAHIASLAAEAAHNSVQRSYGLGVDAVQGIWSRRYTTAGH